LFSSRVQRLGNQLGKIKEVYEFDAVVIGGGIIGASIVKELSESYENILLIEKEDSFGQHTSSRNSEIIHSGIYYPTDTLKAKLCVEGNELLYHFLNKYNIPHKNCGKLVVATNKEEIPVLEKIYQQGKENNVKGLQFLNSEQIKEIEPHIKAARALYVPSTGILDSHSIMNKLMYLAKENGAIVLYNTELNEVILKEKKYYLGFKGHDYKVKTNIVVNSAGLWSHKIAKLIGIQDYELHWCKGEYYKTSKYKNMNVLVYPVPDPEGKYLGIHTVMSLSGDLSFGPNAYYIENEKLDYKVDDSNKKQFYDAINRYLDIGWDDLEPSWTGIRPKLQAKGDLFKDFVIKNEKEKGYNNFINLIGIESPGLTCCLAIAKYVKGLIK